MDPMMLARGATPAHRHLRSRVAVLLATTVALDAAASVVVWRLERHQPATAIRSLGDAVFWTSTQLLTVSSQLPNPISPGARVLDVLLQAYAISIVAILAGSVGAFFHGRTMEAHAAAPGPPTPSRPGVGGPRREPATGPGDAAAVALDGRSGR